MYQRKMDYILHSPKYFDVSYAMHSMIITFSAGSYFYVFDVGFTRKPQKGCSRKGGENITKGWPGGEASETDLVPVH